MFHWLRPRKRTDNFFSLYHRATPFDNGANHEAFQSRFLNPVQNMMCNNHHVGSTPNPFQPPPVYMPTPTYLVRGQHTELGAFDMSGFVQE